MAAPLLVPPTSGKVDQDPSHQLSGNGDKVRAILPADAAGVDQPDVSLVHQGGGLKGVASLLPTHAAFGQTVEFVVHQRRQLAQRGLIAIAPGHQQRRHVLRGLAAHSPATVAGILARLRRFAARSRLFMVRPT
jgi:hypothetical protein